MIITRDSVCMGDDVEEHKIDLEIISEHDSQSAWYSLIDELEKINFFPSVQGEAVWVMICKNKAFEGVEFVTHLPGRITSYHGNFSRINEKKDQIHFKYYSSYEKRAKYIYLKSNGDKYKIWKKGLLQEYKNYKISEKKENEWNQILKCNKKYRVTNITKKLEKEHTCLKTILVRPAMYTGENRLDYAWLFFQGTRYYQHESLWNLDYSLQRWLFLKESVCFESAVSIHAISIFFRYFGIYEMGINSFRTFLNETTLDSYIKVDYEDLVSHHIFFVRNYFKYGNLISQNFKQYIDFKPNELSLSGSKTDYYTCIIRQITRMIPYHYSDLCIYIYLETYYNHIRFFYKMDDDQWGDNVSLNQLDGYYEKLIVLNGYITYIQDKQDKYKLLTIQIHNGSLTADVQSGPEISGLGKIHLMGYPSDAKFLYNQLEEWKDNILK